MLLFLRTNKKTVLLHTTKYYSALQITTKVLLRTTKYCSVLLCTTKCCCSAFLYYKEPFEHYSALQSTTTCYCSTTPVLLCNTRNQSSTTPHYQVLRSTTPHYKLLQKTTPYYNRPKGLSMPDRRQHLARSPLTLSHSSLTHKPSITKAKSTGLSNFLSPHPPQVALLLPSSQSRPAWRTSTGRCSTVCSALPLR